MWDESDFYWRLLEDHDPISPWISFDEVTDTCQRPPAICDAQQAGGMSAYWPLVSVRGFLASRWKTTA